MPTYGGFWIRVLAYIIDAIIVNVAVSLVGFVIGLVLGLTMPAMGMSPETLPVVSGGIGAVLGLVGTWLYFAILESSAHQATFGKKVLGLVVTDESGQRIGFGRATGRYFAKIISGMILAIGFFMVGWTAKKQGLHDMIAGTLVYKASSPNEIGYSLEAFR